MFRQFESILNSMSSDGVALDYMTIRVFFPLEGIYVIKQTAVNVLEIASCSPSHFLFILKVPVKLIFQI